MWFVTEFSAPIHQNVLPVYSNIVTVSVTELIVLVFVYIMVLPLRGFKNVYFYTCACACHAAWHVSVLMLFAQKTTE